MRMMFLAIEINLILWLGLGGLLALDEVGLAKNLVVIGVCLICFTQSETFAA